MYVCVCLIMCDLETLTMTGLGPSWAVAPMGKKTEILFPPRRLEKMFTA